MKVAIMQPYFLPYIGYFQLISAVDLFVVYDNIKYTKKGWINRNRMLQNNKDEIFSLPLKSGSDSLNVCERELACNFNRVKFCNKIYTNYRLAPYFVQIKPLIERILAYHEQEDNLFKFIFNSIREICEYLDIKTKLCISSLLPIDHNLTGEEKVLALCRATGATTYINSIGGLSMYSKEAFRNRGIELLFSQSAPLTYQQLGAPFIAWLSILDVLMFNSKFDVISILDAYTLS